MKHKNIYNKKNITIIMIILFVASLFITKDYLDKNYLKEFNRKEIIGSNRFETMTKISEKGWDKSKEAILVSIHSVIDGISVVPLAYQMDVPIFFVDKEVVNIKIKDELKRLGVEKVYLIGEKDLLTDKVVDDLNALNIKNERIYGKDYFDTSIKIAEKINENSEITEVALVNMGWGKPDGVVASPMLAKRGIPIIMQNKENIDDVVKFIQDHNISKTYIIGSEEIFPKSIDKEIDTDIVRISGVDRYETNKKIIKQFYNTKDLKDLNKIYIIRDGIVNYADFLNGLVLSPVAARENIPILYTSDSLRKEELKFLEQNGINEIIEVGFNVVRPKIITNKMVEFASSIAIIVIWILGIKKTMKSEIKGNS